jgi:hypothetical protein
VLVLPLAALFLLYHAGLAGLAGYIDLMVTAQPGAPTGPALSLSSTSIQHHNSRERPRCYARKLLDGL